MKLTKSKRKQLIKSLMPTLKYWLRTEDFLPGDTIELNLVIGSVDKQDVTPDYPERR